MSNINGVIPPNPIAATPAIGETPVPITVESDTQSDAQIIATKVENGYTLDANGKLQLTEEMAQAVVTAVRNKMSSDGHLWPMPGE